MVSLGYFQQWQAGYYGSPLGQYNPVLANVSLVSSLFDVSGQACRSDFSALPVT